MIKSLFGERKLIYDPTLGDALAGVVLKEAKQGQVNTLLKKEQSLREGEWDRRAFYIELAGKNLPADAHLPDTPFGNLIKGSLEINQAWLARTHGDGSTVSEQGWRLYGQHLSSAREYLVRAANGDPKDPSGLAFLLTVAQGITEERKNAAIYLNEALLRDPLNQQAHYRYLFTILKKWGGSHEAMFDFCRVTMERVPQTTTLYPIMFLAYQEYYLYQVAFAKNSSVAHAFVADPSVREESLRIYQCSLAKRKSIERVSDYWPHNVTIWWFMMLNIPEVVRQETKKVGNHFTEHPWKVFFADPLEGYQKALNM